MLLPLAVCPAQSGAITETADANPDADPTGAGGTITFDDVDLSDLPTASITASVVMDMRRLELAKTRLDDATETISNVLARHEDGTLDPSYLMRTQQIRHDWLIAEWVRQQADRRITQHGQ